MPRTKADNCARKAVAAKAPRKHLVASSPATRAGNSMKSPAGKKGKYGGANSVCPRPTPEWQKEITNFLIRSPKSAARHKENVDPDSEDEETAGAGCSKEDRTEAAQGSSSTSSRVEEETVDVMEDENEEKEKEEEEEEEEEDEETDQAGAASSSSKRKFTKNKCISDSEDED